MAIIHVAGPVVRDQLERKNLWVRGAYSAIARAASEIKLGSTLPYADPRLEESEPKAFYEIIKERVSGAELMVTVFTHGNVSAGVEAGIASMLGKRQLIITDDFRRLPRLLRGLPGVTSILDKTDGEEIYHGVRTFLRENLESSGYAY